MGSEEVRSKRDGGEGLGRCEGKVGSGTSFGLKDGSFEKE